MPANDDKPIKTDELLTARAELITSLIAMLIVAEIGKVVGDDYKIPEREEIAANMKKRIAEALVEFADDVRLAHAAS